MQSRPHRPGPAPTTAGRASESRTAAAPSPRHHWKATPMTVTSTTASGNPHVANAAALASATTTLREFLAFKLGDEEYGVVIVLNIAGRIVGMVVDAVSDVITLTPEQLRPVPAFNSSVDADHLLAIGAIDDRMLILVDIEKLMTSSDMGLLSTAPH